MPKVPWGRITKYEYEARKKASCWSHACDCWKLETTGRRKRKYLQAQGCNEI